MIKPIDNPSHLGSTVSEKHFFFVSIFSFLNTSVVLLRVGSKLLN